MLTNITIGMSSVFLIITLITIISIRELRNSDRYRLLRHLVIALLLVHFFFPFLNLKIRNQVACTFLAGCLHYSLMVAFFWMLIMSTDIYIKIKHSFMDHEKRFVYCRYIAWIAPGIVVLITACATRENYASDGCWLDTDSGAIWTFISCVCITIMIVLVQMTVVGVLIYKKSKLPNQSKNDIDTLKRLRTMIGGLLTVTPVVGIPWMFGIIIIFDDSETMQYIFVILNSTQGFFIWLTQCFFSNEVRRAVKKSLNNKIGPIFDNTSSNTINTR
ncbi:adhesion G-protein coupled receptor D1-like [Antedon mediterranea]|uniref:adhesion G-protein coupled receptor D1-like n=1 Tax=Antedon mediterranea TaxID=105859 RepID=UPI003AF8D997